MTKFKFLLGAIILMMAFTFIGCDTGTGGGGGGTSGGGSDSVLIGSWYKPAAPDGKILTFDEKGNFSLDAGNEGSFSGTYVYNAPTLTLNIAKVTGFAIFVTQPGTDIGTVEVNDDGTITTSGFKFLSGRVETWKREP
jgi:hypothetical protein